MSSPKKNSNDTQKVKFKQFKLFRYYLTTLPTHFSFVDVTILRQPLVFSLIFSNNFVELRRIMVAYLWKSEVLEFYLLRFTKVCYCN